MYLPFDDDAKLPHFRDAMRGQEDMLGGVVLYYTNQCPFTANYVPILPFTTFFLFYGGQL